MTTVRLYRQLYHGGPFEIVATYGQEAEFHKALPGLMGPLPDLISYTCDTGRSNGVRIINVERRLADGDVSRERYKVQS